jgi:hypothetical protein
MTPGENFMTCQPDGNPDTSEGLRPSPQEPGAVLTGWWWLDGDPADESRVGVYR